MSASWGDRGGRWSVLVHGGAGNVPKERVTEHVAGCRRAADAAARVLVADGNALDAAEAAVRVLEDDPCFNAGTGACLNAAGALELDAAIMEGRSLRAGGVCALPPFAHPISIARAVLEDGQHVLYAGAGALAFARQRGFVPSAPEDMITERSRERLAQVLARGGAESWAGGTVGAVVRDTSGNVAAATSTGGTVGKRPGRVGDSPLIGAGTRADALAGAVSATGHGEGMIRVSLASGCLARLRAGQLPEHAAAEAIAELGDRVGSQGGVILVNADGQLGWARSTCTMTWSAAAPDKEIAAGA